MATNNKPVAELRIGAVKATVWENEVGGHAELPFRQPALRCQARRSGAHAHRRAQGRGGPGGWR